jgi:hypothetical protein
MSYKIVAKHIGPNETHCFVCRRQTSFNARRWTASAPILLSAAVDGVETWTNFLSITLHKSHKKMVTLLWGQSLLSWKDKLCASVDAVPGVPPPFTKKDLTLQTRTKIEYLYSSAATHAKEYMATTCVLFYSLCPKISDSTLSRYECIYMYFSYRYICI